MTRTQRFICAAFAAALLFSMAGCSKVPETPAARKFFDEHQKLLTPQERSRKRMPIAKETGFQIKK